MFGCSHQRVLVFAIAAFAGMCGGEGSRWKTDKSVWREKKTEMEKTKIKEFFRLPQTPIQKCFFLNSKMK